MIEVSKPSFSNLEYEMLRSTLASGWIGPGKNVAQFEQECKRIIGCKHFIAVSSCTKAIEITLLLSGCRPGDKVLIPSLTYASVIHVLIRLQLCPVFVEIDEQTLNIDLSDVSRILGQHDIRFIVPVHFRGVMCDIGELKLLALKYKVCVIEDAAHAFGSKRNSVFVGAESYAACFSFGPLKNISCLEGGGIATNSDSLAEALIKYRNLGSPLSTWQRFGTGQFIETAPPLFAIEGAGDKCSMNDAGASVGLAQLERFDEIRLKRQKLQKKYFEGLGCTNGVQLPQSNLEDDFIYIFPILVETGLRAKLMSFLLKYQIRSTVHYPPNHLQPAFRKYTLKSLPKTEFVGNSILTLPFFTDLGEAEQDHVITQVQNFFNA